MTRRPLLLLALLALTLTAACGGGGKDTRPATRKECIGYVAHRWTIDELAALGAADLGEEFARHRFEDETEALRIIKIREFGMQPPDEGAGERAITRCLAERSRANVRCAVRATSLAEIDRCPP